MRSPPPHRTAYFSSTRNPGVVFRVSKSLAREPAGIASTNCLVRVATPQSRPSRLSAVRSRASTSRIGPLTSASVTEREPTGRVTRSPSAARIRSVHDGAMSATSSGSEASPAITPSCRVTIAARMTRLLSVVGVLLCAKVCQAAAVTREVISPCHGDWSLGFFVLTPRSSSRASSSSRRMSPVFAKCA